MQHPASVV